jgi:hypothetical protein
MDPRLVPTILNFDHTAVPSWTESYGRPQDSWPGNTRLSAVPERESDVIEPGEQSTRGVVPTREPDDDGELKLPKMRSLVIMICTNVLLQVSLLGPTSAI